jgi:uncharacterized protein YkwD
MLKKLTAIITAAIMSATLLQTIGAISPYVQGDVNGDGKVNAADAVLVLKHTVSSVAGTPLLGGYALTSADVTGDGKVNAADAIIILRYVTMSISNPNVTWEEAAKPPVQYSTHQTEVLRLVNVERAKAGLAPLKLDEKTTKAATVRAKEIVGAFAHSRPDGRECFTALEEAEVDYMTAGENIAAGYNSPKAVVDGWMNSDGHRANILNGKFTKLGVGYHMTTTGYKHHWVQLFIG